MSSSVTTYLILSAFLFATGLFGLLSRRNFVAILISVELLLNAANLNFLALGRFLVHDPARAQVFALFVIGLAAAETCVGLSLAVLLFRTRGSVLVDVTGRLKG